MNHTTDRIADIVAFVIPVLSASLNKTFPSFLVIPVVNERTMAQWVYHGGLIRRSIDLIFLLFKDTLP